MGETRDRGVRASTDGIDKLEDARSAKRNEDNQPWTYTELVKASGISEKRVRAFFKGESVDRSTARSICQALGVKFEAAINCQDTEIEPDKTGQLSMNPFIYGDPVPPEKFFGRQQAKLEVKNRIGAISSQSVNIVGLRRIGKTSLLRYIRAYPHEFIQPDKQPLIVSLDLQSNQVSTPAGIVEGLRRGIMQTAAGEGTLEAGGE